MKKVQFTLNGKPATIGGPGPQAQKIIDFINSIPNGKFFDTEGISKCLGITASGVEQAIRKNGSQEIEGRFLLIPGNAFGRKKVFGSKASIAQLRKQLQDSEIV